MLNKRKGGLGTRGIRTNVKGIMGASYEGLFPPSKTVYSPNTILTLSIYIYTYMVVSPKYGNPKMVPAGVNQQAE